MPDPQTLRKVEDLSDELLEFERRLGEFNIFDLIGTSHLELAHTRMLAFLFDPLAQHRLGNEFANALLCRLKQENPQKATWLDMNSFEFQGSDIERELQRIDLLVIDQTNRFVILLENKVHSSEHSEQLQRYYDLVAARFPEPIWGIVPVYLTLHGERPSDDRYWAGSYRAVTGAVESVLEAAQLQIPGEVRITLEHYVRMIRRTLVGDWDLEAEARRLYDIAPKAFDFIVQHKNFPVPQLTIFLEHLVKESHLFVLDDTDSRNSMNMVRFSHPAFDAVEHEQRLVRPQLWTTSRRMLLFQFDVRPSGLLLRLEVGPGPEDERQRFINLAQRAGHPFNLSFAQTGGGKRLWRSIYRRTILSEADFFDLDLSRLEELIDDRWAAFLSGDLTSITEAIAREP